MNNEQEEIDAFASQPIVVVQSEQERYVMQRDHAVARITTIIATIDAYSNDIFSLETRREMLEENYQNFDVAQSWLEQWIPDEYTNRDVVGVVNGLTLFEKKKR